MELDFRSALILTGALLFTGVLINKPSKRFGVPGLVLYLSLGLFIGNGGESDFLFDFPEVVDEFSVLALGLILFDGGLRTQWERVRPALREGLSLATAGVLVSAGLVAAMAHLALGLPWLEGLLLGAVLSATDAAAVFSILQAQKLTLKENIAETLQLESGTNDPTAYFLTAGLTAVVAGGAFQPVALLGTYLLEMGVGALLGWAAARFVVSVINRIELDVEGLYPLMPLAMVLILAGATPYFAGNFLLAVYVAGLVVGNSDFVHKRLLLDLFDSLSWLMEIGLFVLLGLQVFPGRLGGLIGEALLVALFLMLIARPLAVLLCSVGWTGGWRKRLFISWVGLRGATPIVFSLMPLMAGLPTGELLFNTVFVVVVISVLCQGTTLGWLARRLELTSYDPEVGPAAHPNSRFTVSAKNNPVYSPMADDANGVPISAIVFGGRRRELAPLVYETKDWAHGVLVGASCASEMTAAASSGAGTVRRDPMAMKPFCGYNFADYFAHWLSFQEKSDKLPKMFHVNWFRKDQDGKFMWPGFGDNMRVLAWILDRVEGKVDANETPIGYLPNVSDIDISGLDVSQETMEALLGVDVGQWQDEVAAIGEYLDEYGARMPQAMKDELAKISTALQAKAA